METNPLRALWSDSKAVVNGWIAIPDGFAAETMARQGWDSITVDMQHGVTHYDTAVECLRAITTTSTVPLARVPWNEPGIVMKALDGGAFGVVCPMVSNREEAERFVGACRYPPDGYRSIGPVRASLYAGADYVAKSAELVVTLAMIETREALDNLDAIMSTPGLDGIYIGPNDLCASLGRPPSLDTRDEIAFGWIETDPRMREAARHPGRDSLHGDRLREGDGGARLLLRHHRERCPPARAGGQGGRRRHACGRGRSTGGGFRTREAAGRILTDLPTRPAPGNGDLE